MKVARAMGKLLGLFLVMAFVSAVIADTKADDGCDDDLKDLLVCVPYVTCPANPKIIPSEACCNAVRKINGPCMCSKVTKEIEKSVCMEKVKYVYDYCKRSFQPGSGCGRYTFPSL